MTMPGYPMERPGCQSMPGNMFCDRVEVDLVSNRGITTINGTHVTKKAMIIGRGDIINAKINRLSVNGTVDVINSEVYNDTVVKGYIESRESNFTNLFVNGNKIKMTNSSADNITVYGADKTMEVELIGKCTIRGNITFVGSEGEVTQSKESKVLGQVIHESEHKEAS